jgi:tRNA pseudouridine38-40 synthase
LVRYSVGVPRYKLTIAYDGTDFYGWQRQEPPVVGEGAARVPLSEDEGFENVEYEGEDGKIRRKLRTVQEVVLRAVQEIVREPVVLLGASRTDSGVHARGQVAAFTTSEVEKGRGWPVERGTEPFLRSLNSRLPEDVLVRSVELSTPTFDPINDCTSKAYSYTLHVSPHRPLWDRNYVHHIWSPLDVEKMNEAAALLLGEHDFAGFAAAGHGRLTTVRTVLACRVVEEEGIEAARQRGIEAREGRVRIDVSGTGFLWNMVRIIAGTLVDVGWGKRSLDDVRKALESGDRRQAGPTLPASGLCLEWIRYGEER